MCIQILVSRKQDIKPLNQSSHIQEWTCVCGHEKIISVKVIRWDKTMKMSRKTWGMLFWCSMLLTKRQQPLQCIDIPITQVQHVEKIKCEFFHSRFCKSHHIPCPYIMNLDDVKEIEFPDFTSSTLYQVSTQTCWKTRNLCSFPMNKLSKPEWHMILKADRWIKWQTYVNWSKFQDEF